MRKEKVIENKYKCTDVWLKIRVRGMRVCACICIPCRCKERNVQDLKKRTEIQLPIFFLNKKKIIIIIMTMMIIIIIIIPTIHILLIYLFKAVEHCKENVWKADFAPPKQITLSETEPNV